ncbi:MurR/RpiR family transcriptional regulator [Cohnella zeiphila]|uniref:MurR/RpiR family transcriptional regulator n=1 Tax=Cohnella zeiphila TaxID=2761120 RepID=A0A7X0SJV3_9BACL|nr:MurR/RpiR family transcriptional regulator [Cohnella zeiphila]MBB6731308.1 MurR/RpiR family transcriptional regulator [Cohnella zeiphila]
MDNVLENGKTLLSIRGHMSGLTKKEQKVAQYILEHAQEVIYQSVTELAERADIGETTVLRLCRKLKFNGFQDFKLSLAQDLVKPFERLPMEVAEGDDPVTISQKLISSHYQILEQTHELLQPGELNRAVDALIRADHIDFYGVGSSGFAAMQAASTFMRMGKNSCYTADTHFQAMKAALMKPGDVAVGISITGSTKDTIDSLTLARKAGATILAITSNARSPIVKLADIVLLTVARENPFQGSSMSSKLSQMTVIDVLSVAVSLGMKDEAFKYRETTAKSIANKMI